LIKRYKRFLADVELPGQGQVTAHTPNTGAMLDCSEPGRPVYLSLSDNPRRKYPYAWEMIAMPDGLVGVNTALPNRLAHLAFSIGAVPGFPRPLMVERERPVGRSRLDLKLTLPGGDEAFVEVKSSTLVRGGVALFPDAVSQRGKRHLDELTGLARGGKRAVLLVLAQRPGADSFSPADAIDPAWGAALRHAASAGVEILAHTVDLTLTDAKLGRPLEVRL
jgi:sugar fermentation stimulation protein A